jgi:hypothetical protein
MTSRTTARFREALAQLPVHVQRQAREAYRLFIQNPNHPSLRFKPVHATRPIYAARVSRDYRAVGIIDGDTIIWFWIGSHASYDRLLTRL